mmetsp:Transcript_4410/g.13469  ORF Transcript_4410/g.13469 Transcript_4410/m.13469 type:complete len:240 (+) Transcript_4410:1233-1952(+)
MSKDALTGGKAITWAFMIHKDGTKDGLKGVCVSLVRCSRLDASEFLETAFTEKSRKEGVRLSATIQIGERRIGGQGKLGVQTSHHAQIEHTITNHFELLKDLVLHAELGCTARVDQCLSKPSRGTKSIAEKLHARQNIHMNGEMLDDGGQEAPVEEQLGEDVEKLTKLGKECHTRTVRVRSAVHVSNGERGTVSGHGRGAVQEDGLKSTREGVVVAVLEVLGKGGARDAHQEAVPMRIT